MKAEAVTTRCPSAHDTLFTIDTYAEEKILSHLRKSTALIVTYCNSTVKDAEPHCVLDEDFIIENAAHTTNCCGSVALMPI